MDATHHNTRPSAVNMADDAARLADIMKRGGVVLYPTDTVWGLGCDATNAEAVARIYAIKQRTDSKALIVLVDSLAMLERIVDEVPDAAYQLIEAAVDPLTIVYDRGIGVAPNLLAPDGSIGVRLAADPFCRALIRRLRRPIVSTSANISGTPSARTFGEIAPAIVNAVDAAALWRADELPDSAAKPSTVIKASHGNVIKILRK